MRFQKAIKRIVALGTGAMMLSSSVFAAADLATYPAPFIKDGKFTGSLVVGDKATAEDVIALAGIQSSLQFAAVKKVSSSGASTVSVDGDAWQVQTSNHLELSEEITGTGAGNN